MISHTYEEYPSFLRGYFSEKIKEERKLINVMSRDFAPNEMYLTDKQYRLCFRNNPTEWKLAKGDGTIETVVSNNNEQLKKEYPELYFLFGNFESLYEKHKNNTIALKAFAEYEEILKKIERGYESDSGEKKIRSQDFKHLPPNPTPTDIIGAWFFGVLDKDFYYNEKNNRMFAEYIENDIRNRMTAF